MTHEEIEIRKFDYFRIILSLLLIISGSTIAIHFYNTWELLPIGVLLCILGYLLNKNDLLNVVFLLLTSGIVILIDYHNTWYLLAIGILLCIISILILFLLTLLLYVTRVVLEFSKILADIVDIADAGTGCLSGCTKASVLTILFIVIILYYSIHLLILN